ncbi:MAG TPA: Bcr/CflA family drug resistance efflux transporter, partial [Microbacterium sp.]|nr:Bcr/CflA family drug resistance efflux transporter [Microbacterium sp.]
MAPPRRARDRPGRSARACPHQGRATRRDGRRLARRVSGAPRLTSGLVATLGFLAAVGPFATDMYLASFTEIAADLGSSASAVQLTLTAFLLGIGAGQLLLGPLSDRFGRRPVMVLSMGVFALSSVLMVFTPTIEVFVALRLVQGVAGAAGIVVARAIAVDLSEGETAVRALSLIATVTALGPLVAPPIGGAVGVLTDWRGVLIVLAAISAAMFLLAVLV